ncbi:MAG: DUF4352 domain-containing protein [Candidatus Promineifilaceae bacterium]|nr:DUF4352 domain-containing protein [Candidatus Promineifilaceae bacterium]
MSDDLNQQDYVDPDLYDDAPVGISGRLNQLRSERGTMVVVIGATVGSAALLCLFIFLLLNNGDADEPFPETTPVEVVSSPAARDVVVEAISDSGTVSITLESPAFLSVSGERYNVLPIVSEPGPDWRPAIESETTAVWSYGTVINYVFAVNDDESNRAILDSVALGDEIVLTTSSGDDLTFAVSSRERVAVNNTDIFAQRAPAVTVMLLEEDAGDDRLVVQGRYVVPDAATGAEAGRVVGIGEQVQLDTLQVTVAGASTLVNRPEIPAGFVVLLVDFQLSNVGSTPINVDTLSLVLLDELGNLYALSPVAAQLGNNRPLSGVISPGQTVAATAGYQIPIDLVSPTLRWQVIARSGSQIEAILPFRDAAALRASVTLQSAQVSADGTNLILGGQVTNLGEQALVIDTGNVTLGSEGTIYLMLSTNPAFPWVVAPGQTLTFQVTFQRPTGSTAVFTILDHAFQLTGLR